MEKTLEIALLIVVVLLVFCAGYLLRFVVERAQDRHVSYRVRSGLDDISAINTDALLQVRDDLLVLEARLQDNMRIMGDIRQGRYDPEQPAAPRHGGDGRKPSR